jgi:hypothetical protein
VGQLRGCEVQPHALAAWAEVARGLLATFAGGGGRDQPRPASTDGGGPRGRTARAPMVPCAIEEPLGSAQGVPRPASHGSRRRRASSSGGDRPQRRERLEERCVEGGG